MHFDVLHNILCVPCLACQTLRWNSQKYLHSSFHSRVVVERIEKNYVCKIEVKYGIIIGLGKGIVKKKVRVDYSISKAIKFRRRSLISKAINYWWGLLKSK